MEKPSQSLFPPPEAIQARLAENISERRLLKSLFLLSLKAHSECGKSQQASRLSVEAVAHAG